MADDDCYISDLWPDLKASMRLLARIPRSLKHSLNQSWSLELKS